ncbi:MAG: hypothetical protein KC445_03900 [Anaerolineales bacterium]|nr:hypothetical protein [Anaerolineales bacterium]
MFSWQHNKPEVVSSIQPATHLHLDVAVLLSDTFMAFSSDTAVYQWAARILHEINPAFQLDPKAKVEAIVGYRGNQHDMYTNIQELVNLMLNRKGLPPTRHVIRLLETETKLPQMQILCAIAVRLDSPE